MNRVVKLNKNSAVRPKKKVYVISLLVILLMLQGCNIGKNNVDIAVKKVSDLFEDGEVEKVKEGEPDKIKDSTNQKHIDAAIEAIDKIDTNNGKHSENLAIVFGLQSAVLIAQVQLKEREGTEDSSNYDSRDEQKEQFQPDENDIVLKNNKLKNKDILEEFINVAGENNDSEIRIVKDEEEKGVIIYDLKSVYDKNVDQGWIDVIPNLEYYIAEKDEAQIVFNIRQQCGYISKDQQLGYYILNECYTHFEYPLLPIINDN
ncbi:hypothetical protein [Lentibacillus saliphilus]|uniref:hypothetical protein n=1 Tax=Lentibacillus saliphilus TaxID=2737028 RepID=UPI001C2FBDC1|nr:hypothetical protein [Lentibacillus saliphilus]